MLTNAEITETSWIPSPDMSFSDWEAAGRTFLQIDHSLNFWIGDWLVWGENKWGETYTQGIEITGWKYERLARAKWVAKNVAPATRRKALSWSCHLHVAHLPQAEQEYWLGKAEEEGIGSAELKVAIKGIAQPAQQLQESPSPAPERTKSPRIPDYTKAPEILPPYSEALPLAEGGYYLAQSPCIVIEFPAPAQPSPLPNEGIILLAYQLYSAIERGELPEALPLAEEIAKNLAAFCAKTQKT